MEVTDQNLIFALIMWSYATQHGAVTGKGQTANIWRENHEYVYCRQQLTAVGLTEK